MKSRDRSGSNQRLSLKMSKTTNYGKTSDTASPISPPTHPINVPVDYTNTSITSSGDNFIISGSIPESHKINPAHDIRHRTPSSSTSDSFTRTLTQTSPSRSREGLTLFSKSPRSISEPEYWYSFEALFKVNHQNHIYLSSIQNKKLANMHEIIITHYNSVIHNINNASFIICFDANFEVIKDESEKPQIIAHEIIAIIKHKKLECYLLDRKTIRGKGGQGIVVGAYSFPPLNEKISKSEYRSFMLASEAALKITNTTIKKEVQDRIRKTLNTYGYYINDCTLLGITGTYTFLKYIDGPNMENFLHESGAAQFRNKIDNINYFAGKRYIPPGYKINLFYEIIRAMMAIHVKGYVHKDIKPSNIILTLIKNRDSVNFQVNFVDFDDATVIDNTRYTHLAGTFGYGDPDLVLKHILAPFTNDIPKINEIQVRYSPSGLEYKTALSKTIQLISWDKLPDNFPQSAREINNCKNIAKFLPKILRITTKNGHTGTVYTTKSDRYSMGVLLAELLSDICFPKALRVEINTKKSPEENTEPEKDKKQKNEKLKGDSASISEEKAWLSRKDLARLMPDIFVNPFLHELLKEKKIAWLHLPTSVLFECIKPFFNDYLAKDIKKLEEDGIAIINEFVFRIHILPVLVEIILYFTHPDMDNRPDDNSIIEIDKKVEGLKKLYPRLCEGHNNLYKLIQSSPGTYSNMQIKAKGTQRLFTRKDLNFLSSMENNESGKIKESKRAERFELKKSLSTIMLSDKNSEKNKDREKQENIEPSKKSFK